MSEPAAPAVTGRVDARAGCSSAPHRAMAAVLDGLADIAACSRRDQDAVAGQFGYARSSRGRAARMKIIALWAVQPPSVAGARIKACRPAACSGRVPDALGRRSAGRKNPSASPDFPRRRRGRPERRSRRAVLAGSAATRIAAGLQQDDPHAGFGQTRRDRAAAGPRTDDDVVAVDRLVIAQAPIRIRTSS